MPVARAIFLDRDGVINRAIERNGRPFAPTRLADFEILPGVADDLRRLRNNGFLLLVVTNQPDVARGRLTKGDVAAMHDIIRHELPVDDISVCFHDDADDCHCRKPKPGLITAAAEKWSIKLSESYLIGDRWRDIVAGGAAGCRATILIDHGYEEARAMTPSMRVASLRDAADWIATQDVRDDKDPR